MNFSYKDYISIIDRLRRKGYAFSGYDNWKAQGKCVIFRHDIDYDIKKSLELAEIEADQAVASTYFVLLTTDFYNVFSKHNTQMLKTIVKMGHAIGLHFDETNYPGIIGDKDAVTKAIANEARILEDALVEPVHVVSMHRPSREILQANLEIPGLINSYSDTFFEGFKYLSDSRRRWREPVEEIIASGEYDRLHILTHAFWYHNEELSLQDTLKEFIEEAEKDRYRIMSENFTNLDEALGGRT